MIEVERVAPPRVGTSRLPPNSPTRKSVERVAPSRGVLVETLSSEWDPAKYEDRYQTAVRELIEAKVQNRPKTAKALAPPIRGAGLDIVTILQESIREARPGIALHANTVAD